MTSAARDAARLLLLVAFALAAHAGPPYVSDDPQPTSERHFEIYGFTQGLHNEQGTSGTSGVDFNYGAGPDLQLTAVVPQAYERPRNAPASSGVGNIELAVKYRFAHQHESGWDIAFFPRVFLPSASSAVGPRHAAVLLPLWLERDWGGWSSFGGGGCALNRGGDSRSYCLASWALAYQLRPDLQLGAELVYQSPDTYGMPSELNAGAGGALRPQQHLSPAGIRRSWPARCCRYRALFVVRIDPVHLLASKDCHRMEQHAGKVPAITLGFWIIKILATTLGETGGDTVTMTMNWGYLAGTALFLGALVVLVFLQIRASRFHPWLYWATIVASTTAGTTMADFADRSLGIGYAGGALLLLACVLGSLWLWQRTLGSISLQMLKDPKAEAFYWLTITFSQTLGTALGDWMADDSGLGYEKSAVLFAALLAVVAAAYFWTHLSRLWLFWAAFILTRPLGATVGDFLDKPTSHGGLSLSRPLATAVIAVAMILCITLFPKNAAVSAERA